MQLRTVTFDDLSPEYCEAVAAGLGAQLLSVIWNNCNDLSLLAPCTRLEELEIRSVDEETMTHYLNGEFLPNLRKLSTYHCCLRQFGRTFETVRPSLTEVRLDCAHFGCDQQVSVCNWEDLPRLWPNLEHFSFIQYNEHLTMNSARHIFPQLKKLKSVNLPIETMFGEFHDAGPSMGDHLSTEEFRNRLVALFWDLPSPIQLQLEGKKNDYLDKLDDVTRPNACEFTSLI
jgi:hypothetical protein